MFNFQNRLTEFNIKQIKEYIIIVICYDSFDKQNNLIESFKHKIMINERSESRKRKYSSSTKTKFDFELPKINKTNLLIKDRQKQNLSVLIPTFAEKVAWVIQTKDYSTLSEQEIDEQYNKLRKQLQNINAQVEKAVEKLDFRITRKTKASEHDPARTLQITDKQSENNNAIIDRLRKENLQLQKRLSSVSAVSKDEVEEQILKAKTEIEKCKNKIKQLKMKNKNIGDSIMNTDDVYAEIKRLESEKQVNERKKMKLQAKTDHVYDQISSSELKLEQISDNFQVAENFFTQYYDKSHQSEQQKQLQIKYQHAKHCYEVVVRKNQSSNNSKQQKYHIMLKGYQAETGKLNLLEQKTASVELQIIHQLQQLYKQNETKKQILNQEPVFFTEFEGEYSEKGDKNDKNEAKDNQLQTRKQVAKTEKFQRNKTQNKQNALVIQTNKNNKHEQQNSVNQQPQINERKRLETSNGLDPQEQDDVMVDLDLDEKFKYKTKTNMKNSGRYNEKQTQIGQDLPEDVVDEDDEIIDFKSKIYQQKINRKSKEGFNISKDIDKIKTQLDKMDFLKNNSESFD